MKQTIRVLHALREGPGTSSQIAIRTDLPIRTVSAVLSTLEGRGVVKTVGERKREYPNCRTEFIRALNGEDFAGLMRTASERRPVGRPAGIPNRESTHLVAERFFERIQREREEHERDFPPCGCQRRIVDGRKFLAAQPDCPAHGLPHERSERVARRNSRRRNSLRRAARLRARQLLCGNLNSLRS